MSQAISTQLPSSSFPVTVDGLSMSVDEMVLSNAFQQFGNILRVNMVPSKSDKTKRFGYVNFSKEKSARKAALEMNGKMIHGSALVTKFVDYRQYTDCKKYMTSDQGVCFPADGESCPYRHKSTSNKVCDKWAKKKCKNVECQGQHPQFSEIQNKPAVKTTPPAVQATPPIHSTNNKLEEVCKCAICLERVQQPKTLVCEHSFCKECLDEIVKINADVVLIKCPTCQAITNLKPGETVASMKASLVLKQTLDILQQGYRDSSSPMLTKSCSTNKCKEPLSKYCEDCCSFHCTSCFKAHRIESNCCNFHSVKYSRSIESFVPYCKEHDCVESYGCHTCAESVCVYCLENKHEDHQSQSIVKFLSAFKEPLDNATADLKLNKQVFDGLLDNLMDVLTLSEKNLLKLKEDMKDKKIVILSRFLFMLNAAEQQILKNFTDTHSVFKEIIQSHSDECSVKLAQYNSAIESANSLLHKTSVEIISQSNKVVNGMKEVARENKPPDDPSYADFSVRIKDSEEGLDQKLLQVIAAMFGNIEVSLIKEVDNYEMIDAQIDTISLTGEDLSKLTEEDAARSYINEELQAMGLIEAHTNDAQEKKNKNKNKKTSKKKEEKKNDSKANEASTVATSPAQNLISFDERPPTELLLGGSITVQTEGDLDFDADERDQQWENNEEEDDEGEGSDGSLSTASSITSEIDQSNLQNADAGKQKKNRNRNKGRGSSNSSNRQEMNRGGRGSGRERGRGRGNRGANRGNRGGTRGNYSNNQFVDNIPPLLSGYSTFARPQFPPTTMRGSGPRNFRGGGSYQRPSSARSDSNLHLLEEPVMVCYRCGRNGHTVAYCGARTTTDGRSLNIDY